MIPRSMFTPRYKNPLSAQVKVENIEFTRNEWFSKLIFYPDILLNVLMRSSTAEIAPSGLVRYKIRSSTYN